MKREWKPGDVVRVRYGTVDQIGIIRPRPEARGKLQVLFALGGFDMVENLVRDGDYISRVVTIDAEDREQVERLVEAYFDTYWSLPEDVRFQRGHQRKPDARHFDALATALREFANSAPPKPEEPTGLGAVVEDATGMRWVRVKSITTVRHWRHEHGGDRKRYDDIAVVRVLSEGVTS